MRVKGKIQSTLQSLKAIGTRHAAAELRSSAFGQTPAETKVHYSTENIRIRCPNHTLLINTHERNGPSSRWHAADGQNIDADYEQANDDWMATASDSPNDSHDSN